MPNSKHVLFLIDHKHRDLPSASLIGHHLSKKGYIVKYCAYWQEDILMGQFNPEYIILGKPVYSYMKLAKWRAEGRKWIALDVEGNPQDIIYEMKVEMIPDMSIYWNNKEYSAYENYYRKKSGYFKPMPDLRVLGCPRIDFHHESLSHLFESKEDILKRFDLSAKFKTITIATSTQDSHFSAEKRANQAQTRDAVLSKSADYSTIVRNMEILRDNTERLIALIANSSDDYNIVLKPHPNENVIFWETLFHRLNFENARVMKGETINNLLAISDIHIAHNVCTTTFEAMLHSIPTVEMHTFQSSSLYEAEHLNLASYKIRDPEEISDILRNVFSASSSRAPLEFQRVNKYCEKNFGTFDGNRCQEYAKYIDEFIKANKGTKRTIISLILDYSIFFQYFVANRLRAFKWYIIRRIRGEKAPISDDVTVTGNTDMRGRFDNRIIPGDEELWLQKYKRHIG